MNSDTMSAKDLRLAISAMKRQANFLLNKGKLYEPLLLEILQYDYYSDEDQPFPNGKELQQKLGIKPEAYKKQLEQIYNDLLESAWVSPKQFTFSEVEYIFYAKYFEKSVSFMGHIPIRPVVGEGFHLPFFKSSFHGMDFFYVSKISHEFTDTKQRICVWLECGFYNFYEKFKKEQDEYEEKERREKWAKLRENG
jgi:hypothetical protein